MSVHEGVCTLNESENLCIYGFDLTIGINMSINLSSNIGEVVRGINLLDKQVRFAYANALNKTALHAKADLATAMTQVFDRPTPYTLNSVGIAYAKRDKPEARVYIKDFAGKGTPATKYLHAEVFGGSRRHKRFEKALQAQGHMGAGQYVVPAAGAKMDAFGNASRGQIVQIMSQLKLQRTAGYESRASDSARSKATRKKQGVAYFVVKQSRGKLKAGIYLRRTFAKGSAVKPVFLFVNKANYEIRFKFFDVANDSANKYFPIYYKEALHHALSTAR